MNEENLDQVLVFCKDFKHKSKRLSATFGFHPRNNYVYKALKSIGSDELRVYLPSEDKSMFGIRFDAMKGGEKEYSYHFEIYSAENCMDLDPESLNLLSTEQMVSWEEGLEPKLPFEDHDSDIEIIEDEISTMTLSEMIKSDSMFLPYAESLLISIKAHSEEILQGLVYSIEDTVEVLSEGFKIGLDRNEVISRLQEKLENQKINEKPYTDTEMVMLFFTLYYLNNKGN